MSYPFQVEFINRSWSRGTLRSLLSFFPLPSLFPLSFQLTLAAIRLSFAPFLPPPLLLDVLSVVRFAPTVSFVFFPATATTS